MSRFFNKYKLLSILFIIFTTYSYLSADFQIKIDNCYITSNEKDSLIATYLQKVIVSSTPDFEQFFTHKLQGPVFIKLVESENDYRIETKDQLPEWSSGVAFLNEKKIILKPRNFFDPENYRIILLHELAHIYLSEKLEHYRIPLWLNEGIAMYLSGENISWGESITLGNAILAGNIISLTEIDSLLKFGNIQANIAYLEAFLAVDFLIINHGEDAVINIINDIPDIKQFEKTFLKNVGIDLIDFEFEWYEYLKKRFRWMVILQFENILWISLVLIIFIAFIIMKIRNRRIMNDWKETESS